MRILLAEDDPMLGAIDSQQRFIASAAHELRTPTAALMHPNSAPDAAAKGSAPQFVCQN